MTTDGYKARQDLLHDHVLHIHDLSKENKALHLIIQAGEVKIADLQVDIVKVKHGHLEVSVKLENANIEVTKLTLKLEDANNEIGRLSMALNHQGNNRNSAK